MRLDDRDVRRGLRQMRRAGKDLRPVLRRLKRPLREDLEEHADSERGPDGSWPRRAPRTQRPHHDLLGKLPSANTIRQRGQSLQGQNPIPWSAAHNDGDVVGRGSIIPSRPFLFFSDSFLDQADEAVVDHVIKRGWEKK